MSGKIYLVQGEGQLVAMTEQAYDTEDVLQGLLANYPDLLAGEQINPESPRRWLLLSREASLPSEEGGAGRWSVDHLFVDQDGIPTIVEVKCSTDTRIRREVVGQMLDYAANAVVYWPVETLRAQFEAQSDKEGSSTEEQILTNLGLEDADSLWHAIRTNLQAGRVRMIFVADVIPPELRRVVEFLNAQMNPAEVIAVEVRQYEATNSPGQKALVSRVVGQTQQALTQKTVGTPRSRPPRDWDYDSFVSELRMRHGQDAVTDFDRIVEWSRARDLVPDWGHGPTHGTFYPDLYNKRNRIRAFAVWTSDEVSVDYTDLSQVAPFDDIDTLEELVARLNAIPGVSAPSPRIRQWINIKLAPLRPEDGLPGLLRVFDWVIEEIRSA